MGLFDVLTGISPWYWVAFALFLGVLEMATMSFFLIWPALAAALMAVLMWLFPDMSGIAQVFVFSLSAIALTFAGRSLMNRYGDGEPENELLNNRSNQVVGRLATVLEFRGGTGAIDHQGTRWRAHWVDDTASEVGDTVVITKADGMDVWVRPK